MANSPLGSAFLSSTGRSSPPREYRSVKSAGHVQIADHPGFGVGSQRFNKRDTGGRSFSPEYHVAYREVTQPSRWSTKGWTGIDDALKAGRGTSVGKHYSSMAPTSPSPATGSSLQPLYATYPNETRLQELLELQRRKTKGSPGPGAYEAPGWKPSKTSFRRGNMQGLDGPFFLNDHNGHNGLPVEPSYAGSMASTTNGAWPGETTRARELAAYQRNPGDSGLGPGDYEGLEQKDATSALRTPVASSIGTAAREGRTPHLKSLSISRSIQHGIDWHVPVIVQSKKAAEANRQHDHEAAATSPSPPPPPGLESCPSRYMDSSPPRAASVGRPPVPPHGVGRTVRRPEARMPGNWDWDRLGHNFRNSWTTLHGGAYSHGDRTIMRRAATAPEGSTAPPGSSALASFGPSSSIDPAALGPPPASEIFPIPEESSSHLREIIGAAGGGYGSSSSGAFQQQPAAHLHGPDSASTATASLWAYSSATGTPGTAPAQGYAPPMFQQHQHGPHPHHSVQLPPPSFLPRAGGGSTISPRAAAGTFSAAPSPDSPLRLFPAGAAAGTASGAGSPNLAVAVQAPSGAAALVSAQELARRNEALAAASQVQRISTRRNEWLARSSSAVGGGSPGGGAGSPPLAVGGP